MMVFTHSGRVMDAQMLALIRAIHEELKGAYVSPRMFKELRGRGFPASKERVERLMRENGGHRDRCFDDGVVPGQTGGWIDPPL